MKNLFFKILGKIFNCWLKYVERTANIEIVHDGCITSGDRLLLGFWHGNSPAMLNFISKMTEDFGKSVEIIVTASGRGDVIEYLINKRGGSALRINDGLGMSKQMNEAKEAANLPTGLFGIALDGPYGPGYEPKKLGAYMSEASGRRFVCCHVGYSKVLILKRRWDKYAVPLPYAKMVFTITDFGIINQEQVRSFKSWKDEILEKCNGERKIS